MFAALVAALTEGLESRGWRQRVRTAVAPGVWTMSLTNGFTATAQVMQVNLVGRRRLPIRVQFLHGVGHELATELLTSLGLSTRYTVRADPSSYTPDAAISLTKETDLDARPRQHGLDRHRMTASSSGRHAEPTITLTALHHYRGRNSLGFTGSSRTHSKVERLRGVTREVGPGMTRPGRGGAPGPSR